MAKTKLKNSNVYFGISILLLLVVGLLMGIISQQFTSEFWKASFSNISSALIVAGVLSFINEKIMKENLIEIILDKVDLKKNIDTTGVSEIHTNISNIKYSSYLKNSEKNIDIIHTYGRTWTSNNIDEISEKLLNSDCNIRIVLVNPNSLFIDGLAYVYGETSDGLRQIILDMSERWKELYEKKEAVKGKTTESSIKLYYHKNLPSCSLYRFDDNIINVQSKLSCGRSKKLTSIVCTNTEKEDDVYSNFNHEIEQLIKESEEIPLDKKNDIIF